MSSPTTGTATHGSGFTSSATPTATVALTAGRLVLVGAMIEDSANARTVTTMTSDVGSLRFVRIGSRAGVIASEFAGTSNYNIEVWGANGTITNGGVVITANLSGVANGSVLYITEVVGAAGLVLDSNVGNPYTGLNASGSPTVVITTAQADDLLLMWVGKDGASGLAGPAGWSDVVSAFGGGGSGNHGILGMISKKSVSAIQSGVSVIPTTTNAGVAVCVAITADSGGSSPFCGSAIPLPT